MLLLLMFQSTFGRKSLWSPLRGTSPEMLFRKLSVLVTCAVVKPLPVASEPVRVGLVVPANAGQVVKLIAAPAAAVSAQVSARFRKSKAVKVETPGKLRFC